ncbi:MAG: hypothetical protein M1453_10280 [Acidobacteria bacterium]|nr:hypothetical protein [Acidobacteriota bacterium]MCL5288365.1 hypothetical protein [Acidobacteriota bacterium]
MKCSEFLMYSDEWMEGGRMPAAAAHVQECARCRGLIAEMEAIAQAAAGLAAETPEPSERVWTALRAQLESEGLIRQRGLGAWFADVFAALPRPALAGAYVAVLLAALVLGSISMTSVQEATDSQRALAPGLMLQPQFAQAEQQEMVKLHRHDPAVTASYRDNLEIVDKFIVLCEKTVREEPRNQMAREYLYSAYQQKAELLASMTERATGGDE